MEVEQCFAQSFISEQSHSKEYRKPSLCPNGLASFDPSSKIIRYREGEYVVERRRFFNSRQITTYKGFLTYIEQLFSNMNDEEKADVITFLSMISKVANEWNVNEELHHTIAGICKSNSHSKPYDMSVVMQITSEDSLRERFFSEANTTVSYFMQAYEEGNLDELHYILEQKDQMQQMISSGMIFDVIKRACHEGKADVITAILHYTEKGLPLTSQFIYELIRDDANNMESYDALQVVLNDHFTMSRLIPLHMTLLLQFLTDKDYETVLKMVLNCDGLRQHFDCEECITVLNNNFVTACDMGNIHYIEIILAYDDIKEKLSNISVTSAVNNAWSKDDTKVVETIFKHMDLKNKVTIDFDRLAFANKCYGLSDAEILRNTLNDTSAMSQVPDTHINHAFQWLYVSRQFDLLDIMVGSNDVRKKLSNENCCHYFRACCLVNKYEALVFFIQQDDVNFKLPKESVIEGYQLAFCHETDNLEEFISLHEDFRDIIADVHICKDFFTTAVMKKDIEALKKIVGDNTERQQLTQSAVNVAVEMLGYDNQCPLDILTCLFNYSDIRRKLSPRVFSIIFRRVVDMEDSNSLLEMLLADENLRSIMTICETSIFLIVFAYKKSNSRDFLNILAQYEDLRLKIDDDVFQKYVNKLISYKCYDSILWFFEYPDLRKKVADVDVKNMFIAFAVTRDFDSVMTMLGYEDIVRIIVRDDILEKIYENIRYKDKKLCDEVSNLLSPFITSDLR
jgi:hypothetical protein